MDSHGMSKTTEWNIWENLRQRCGNPNHPRYEDYGGRGITGCKRWNDSFANFLEDMGKRPDGMTLDRIYNNAGYNPKNCQWTSFSQQNLNKRLYKRNTTGHRGIIWYKPGNKYRVQIKRGGVNRHVGYFDKLSDAIAANNKARGESQ